MKIKKYLIFLFIFLSACSDVSKCNYIGCEYLGSKYVSDPLGEEKLPDKDSLIRSDAFDCMTFVETSLAHGDINKLNKIRYKNSEIDFLKRNHFTEYDWVNNNSNLIENVTEYYGKTKTRTLTIDKKSWFKKTHNIDTEFKTVKSEIKYIPYQDLKNIKTKDELIVLFIINNPKLKNKIGSDLSVSHMGFILPNGMLRHASSEKGFVVDTNFMEYVKIKSKSKTNLGVALYKIK